MESEEIIIRDVDADFQNLLSMFCLRRKRALERTFSTAFHPWRLNRGLLKIGIYMLAK